MAPNPENSVEKEKLLQPTGYPSDGRREKTTEHFTEIQTTGSIYKTKFMACVCTMVIFFLTLLFVLSSIVSLTCGIAYSQYSDEYTTTSQLGCDNDTVVVGRVSSFLFSHVTVNECLKEDDYMHVSDIFLEETDKLVNRTENYKYSSINYHQSYPSTQTGRYDYLYLLEGSRIQYTICIASEASDKESGHLYIFDDQLNYLSYTRNPENGERVAVFSKVFPIGANNKHICTTVHYNVERSSYYFITSKTQVSIRYNYTLVAYDVYYNHNDFEPAICHTGGPGAICYIKLPGGLFHPRDIQILAYIEPPIAADPFSTHICMTPHISDAFTIILLSSVSAMCVLCVVLCTMVACGVRQRHRLRRRRIGYVIIN